MSATPPPPPPGGAQPPPGGTPPPGGPPSDPSQPGQPDPNQPDPNQPGYGAPPPAGGYQTPPPTPGYAAPQPGGQINYSAPQGEQKSGLPAWAWVLIVVGALFLLCGAGTTACLVWAGDTVEDAADDLDDAFEEVPEGDYSIEIDECEVDEFGSATASGTFENQTGTRQGFEITIEMTDDGTLVESPSTITDTVDDGTELEWEVFGTADEDADLECEVGAVNKTIFDDEDENIFGD